MEAANQNDPNFSPLHPSTSPPSEQHDDEAGSAALILLQQQAAEYLQGWQRANADYANLKREMERMRDEFMKYACAGFIERMLPAYEALEKAMIQRPDVPEAKQWVEGISHIKSQFDKALLDAKVEKIESVGSPFDPNLHEAMLNQAEEGVAPGTVIQVLEKGYKLHDKVIRPAKVVVAE